MSTMNLDVLLSTYKRYMAAEAKSPRTIESTEASVRQFACHIGQGFDIERISADGLRDYIIFLQSRPRWQSHPTIAADKGPLSPFTVATRVRTIKAFWSWLAREEFITEDPFRRVKTPKTPCREVRILTPEICRALIDSIPKKGLVGKRDRALLLALLGLGARISELTSLRTGDVDFDSGQVRVLGKGSKERRLFMSPLVFKAMHKYWFGERKDLPGDWFFVHKDGRPLDRWYVNHQLHKYAVKAGIGLVSVSPHKARHTFATLFLRNGGDIFSLQKILGHSTLDMSRHYAQMADEDVERQMRAHSPVEAMGLKL